MESVTETVRYDGALRCVTVRYGDALGALCWYVTVRYAGAGDGVRDCGVLQCVTLVCDDAWVTLCG